MSDLRLLGQTKFGVAHQRLNEVSVATVRRHSTGRRVRMRQISALLEGVHFMAYRGWRRRQGVLLHHMARRNRRRGLDVVLNDKLQYACASV